MTPEQKKEYFEMVTDLICIKGSEVERLPLGSLRISVGNRTVWVEMKNIPFWKRGEFREIVNEKLRRQEAILEERHINDLKSLINKAQLRSDCERPKAPSGQKITEGIKPEEIKFHGAEAPISGAVHYIRMNPEHYSLWIEWLGHMTAHHNLTESNALTRLLKLGTEHLLLSNPRTTSKTETEKCMEKPLVVKHTGENTVVKFNGVDEAISATRDGESCLSFLLNPRQERMWEAWLKEAYSRHPSEQTFGTVEAITLLLNAGLAYAQLGYLDKNIKVVDGLA